jgi:molecular chaperone GrpE
MTEIKTVQEQHSKDQDADWEDRYKRLAAELDNIRKRLARNSSQAVEQMQDQLLLEMLPVADNLARILSNQADDPGCSQLVDGIRLTYRDFQNALKRYGVEPIEALNRPFDPNIHEAAAMIEHPSHPGGVVIEVIQRGYLRDGRLLRPAQVIVSAVNCV